MREGCRGMEIGRGFKYDQNTLYENLKESINIFKKHKTAFKTFF